PEALYERPIAERHRLVFYLGHLETFDWNLLGRGEFDLEPHDAGFDKLFAFGIDPTQGNLPADKPEDWPRETQIRRYIQTTRRRLDDEIHALDGMKALPPLVADGTLLHVAIEHRLMHAETLAYLLQRLPHEKKRGRATSHSPAAPPHQSSVATIPRGTATLGQPRRNGHPAASPPGGHAFPFGWDNEFESCVVDVPEFRIGVFPVTNAEFLEFVRAGGYSDPGLWNAEDWSWKESHALAHPVSWEGSGADWFCRGMFERVPLPLDWPVYVSHAEASAYARWAARSLPTEAQWHRAAYGTPDGDERIYPWGDAPPDPTRGNFDFAAWDPQPVASHPSGASAFGVQDLVGNGWEWTSTPFAPFPGFEPFPFYRGYSADFFDGRHFVMKGGSARTAECLLRRPFRNWFQPRYPYVFATFRCVEA
ncbi:MAG TPA: SUMF1/EgtB/PvdO family nonheme iron enzyme, partial [Candidatus Acidoferrales bacterium]|nr:SUMF1/EgtB/PvdO family nonheme iron enzyme [Candidatus Acidoferrales bacterium]